MAKFNADYVHVLWHQVSDEIPATEGAMLAVPPMLVAIAVHFGHDGKVTAAVAHGRSKDKVERKARQALQEKVEADLGIVPSAE